MSNISLEGNASGTGTFTIAAPNTSSNFTLTLPQASGTIALGTGLTGVTDSASPYETSLGEGAGGSSTGVNNTFIGFDAGNDNTTGTDNTAVGYAALDANTTGTNNVAMGVDALGANTSGANNAAFGFLALSANTTAAGNNAFGRSALLVNTTGAQNIAVGNFALAGNTTGNRNTALGNQALEANTTAENNTAVGADALKANTTGYSNTAVGYAAGSGITTGHTNLTIGVNCTTELTTGNDNTCVNALNGGNRVFALTTESNRILIGYNGVTNAYVQVAWTVVSDSRDKTDVVDAPYGLSFVQELRPVQYRWDRRSKYENNQPDGTHKEDKKQLGFLAQDVIALEKKYGGVAKDLLIGDDEHDETLKITETKIIPILVKAIQELSAKVAALEAQLATPPATSPAEPNA